MRIPIVLLAIVSAVSVPASAVITVGFEQIARTGGPVPGQPAGSVFSTNFSNPSINDQGVIVFNGIGSASAGIYAKVPSQPAVVLVDQATTAGVFNFQVPGQPAGTVFTNFLNKTPLLNNQGDVVFFAGFSRPIGSPPPSGGNGIYATNVATPGVFVKLVDSTDTPPNSPTASFEFFEFSLDTSLMVASLDDSGNVAIFGRYKEPGGFPISAIYATTVAGGPLLSLVDSGGTIGFTPSALVNRHPANFLATIQSEAPALNNNGDVVFRGFTKLFGTFLNGVFSVPLNGLSDPTIVALRFDVVPTSTGSQVSLNSFRGADVNDAGQVLMRIKASSGGIDGYYVGDVNGGAVAMVLDDAGGFPVPGKVGVNFRDFQGSALNESGQFAFLGTDDAIVPTNGGVYGSDISGSFPFLVANTFGIAPPGRPAPAILQSFSNSFRAPAINDQGNMVFGASGSDQVSTTIFGMYFYNACAGTLERIADDLTAPLDLGGSFAASGRRNFLLFGDLETRAGHYRAINNSNDVAFLVEFSNFDEGIYVARISGAGSGGAPVLNCPPPVTIACDESTDPSTNLNLGIAAATDACTGDAIATGFTDVTYLTGCNGTGTLVRTWSAMGAGGEMATCDQIIVVVDNLAPTLTAPADVIVECDAIPAPETVIATDNCDTAPVISFSEQSSGGCLASTTLTRTWTATDACGNTSSASQVVTVQDTTPPIATAGLTLLTNGDGEGSDGDDDDEGMFVVVASCSDNCSGLAGCTPTTLSAVITCEDGQSVVVTPGQLVEIEDEDEGDCEIEYEDGELEIEGRVTLTVTCTDASNNSSTATALPVGIAFDNDDETEDDD
jgi:hypothetical protein